MDFREVMVLTHQLVGPSLGRGITNRTMGRAFMTTGPLRPVGTHDLEVLFVDHVRI